MKIRYLVAAAALVSFSNGASAHPGHGNTPRADGSGKPHVHFGTPKAVVPVAPRKLPTARKSGKAASKTTAQR